MKDGKIYDGAVTWSSSDKKIVKVIDGQLTAISEGTVTITASLEEYPEL